PHTLSDLLIERNTVPSVIPAVALQTSTAALTHCGTGTVRMCPALPFRSAITQCSSRTCIESIAKDRSSPRRRPHPISNASKAWLGTIPLDEVVNGVVVRSLPAHGREGIEDSRFGLFEIRQCKDPLRRSLLSGFRHDRRLLRPSPLLWSRCQSVE